LITINEFLQESYIMENITYSKEKLKEYKKKKYKSNGYWWIYIGGKNYGEMPLHNYIWNLHNPTNKVSPRDKTLIHHKDENKLNNAPSNLIKVSKSQHDRDHLIKKRKKFSDKFSSETASKGGKEAQRRNPNMIKKKKNKIKN